MRIVFLAILFSTLYAQGFGYNYIDPCNQQAINLQYRMEPAQGGFWVTYYNKRQYFTFQQVLAGELEVWSQNVYREYEKLFPCAVNVAEEVLASATSISLSGELDSEEEDDATVGEPSFVGGDIVNTIYDYGIVTSLNSVYTSENFDLTRERNYTVNVTLDLKKILGLHGITYKKLPVENQTLFWNLGFLYYETFEGSDWLITGNYGKVIKDNYLQIGLLSSSIGKITNENFFNINSMYGYRYPIYLKNENTLNLQTFVSYTIFRYFEGFKEDKKYLLLESPILLYPGMNMDFKFTNTFKVNLGFYVGLNTLVNDIGKRNINYSIVFGANF